MDAPGERERAGSVDRAVDVPLKPAVHIAPKPYPLTTRPHRRQGDRAEEVVANLAAQRGVLGVVLARRDGFPVISRWHEPVDIETFSALHAAALNAAEVALGGRARGGMGLMVDQGDRRVLSRAVGRDLFFVVAVRAGADWESAFLWIEAAGLDVQD